ncbi:MAG: DUF4382 domain-containing protein [Gammaproteobacteria bacterium]|nr:DUF4382 domain-containing protein [Gammaproteobacteria bacterium]NNM20332.1 DUF4382 domain-containing protein [Gammaproteobacteria bacterium]
MTLRTPTGWTALLLLIVALAGCGSSSGDAPSQSTGNNTTPTDSSACSDDCGTVMIGLTDADGDFLEYTVGVSSLSLERADGVSVEAIPQSATVDFAQYTELTEFLTAATVPPGTYVAAQITLDYAGAAVSVELDGAATETQVVAIDGSELGVETFRIQLADDRRLVVRPGLPSIMVVDFDLAASHEVDLDTNPVTATAAPFLVADIDPVDSKPMRLRGPLVSVNADESNYVVALRPFWAWRGDFGRVRVFTTDDTAFEIDGTSYAGADGLLAMSALPAAAATLAFGELETATRQFTAREVYAGSSVPGHAADIVKGVITARVDDVLTVRGATLVRERDTAVFRGDVEVIVGPQTTVRKAGDAAFDGSAAALSVGQRVIAYGRIANDTPDELVFDATDGVMRMLRSVVTGTTNLLADAQINIDLQQVAGRNVRIFDFSGTGVPGQDADPQDYEVATGNLDTSALQPGSPVKASGFVTAFGMAPPDFEAGTIADFSDSQARLFVGWNPATATPFLTLGPEGLVIDLENPEIGSRHHVVRGGIVTNLLEQPGASIVPRGDRPGIYAIRDGRSIRLHTDFGLFTRDLANALGGGATVRSTHASGSWSDTNAEFQSGRLLIRLN